MRWFILIVLLFSPLQAIGATIGSIVQHEGKVTVFRQGAVRGEAVRVNSVPLMVGDVVTTQTSSQAWLLLGEDRVLLREDSSLLISGLDRFGVEQGRVLFDIRKRSVATGIRVVGPTATIGVKGTRFAVARDGATMDIYLKEGSLEVSAITGELHKYADSLQKDFDALRQEMQAQHEAVRDKMRSDFERSVEAMRQGDLEAVTSFDMEAGMAYRIAGREVRPLEFTRRVEDDFRLLESFPNR